MFYISFPCAFIVGPKTMVGTKMNNLKAAYKSCTYLLEIFGRFSFMRFCLQIIVQSVALRKKSGCSFLTSKNNKFTSIHTQNT